MSLLLHSHKFMPPKKTKIIIIKISFVWQVRKTACVLVCFISIRPRSFSIPEHKLLQRDTSLQIIIRDLLNGSKMFDFQIYLFDTCKMTPLSQTGNDHVFDNCLYRTPLNTDTANHVEAFTVKQPQQITCIYESNYSFTMAQWEFHKA